MQMVVAFSALIGKMNLLTSDRLSILANLAGYEWHVDVAALVKAEPDISFSACILALSFANGDVSLLTDKNPFRALYDPRASSPSWISSHEAVYTARPTPQHAFTGRITATGYPCTVAGSMLVVPGVLWTLELCEHLLPLQKCVRDCLEICRLNPSTSTLVGVELFKAVARHLFHIGQDALVCLISTLALGKKWGSPAELYHTMQQLRVWHTKGGPWPSLPWGGVGWSGQATSSSALNDLKLEASARFTITRSPVDLTEDKLQKIPVHWGSTLLRWLYLTAEQGAPFPLGRCKTRDGQSQELAIFQTNLADPTMALVPIAELNYEFSGFDLLNDNTTAFWQVRKTEVPEIPEEEVEATRARLEAMGHTSPQVSNEPLIIREMVGSSGIWSPLLTERGALEWDDQLKSFSMQPLRNCGYFFLS